jgi:hypothetical protein
VAGTPFSGEWTDGNALAPLTGSLNPAGEAKRLSGLPQVHFAGGRDMIVAPAVVDAYASRFANPACLRVVLLPDIGHNDGWAEIWPDLLRREPRCVHPA